MIAVNWSMPNMPRFEMENVAPDSSGARSFRFRARSRYEPGYPFLLGISSPVRVGVG